MPLLDHFHAPVSHQRTWEGFHSLWAAAIVEQLNQQVLSEDYFADLQVHVGSGMEIDVATLTEPTTLVGSRRRGSWEPEPPTQVFPLEPAEQVEIQVFTTAAGAGLVAAIELVSPGNKDRPEARRAFVAKCETYLTRGIGLIVADVVTNRLANLHDELLASLGIETAHDITAGSIYAVAYRPRYFSTNAVEVWSKPLTLGEPLPTLPLALRSAETVPLDLEASYTLACERSRLRMAA